MKYFFSLKISALPDQVEKISEILGIKSNYPHGGWMYEMVKNEGQYFNFIEYFLNVLEDKYDKLKYIGIGRDNISVWMIYEYEDQCNMEFMPSDIKRLGENGITLCVSCYKR